MTTSLAHSWARFWAHYWAWKAHAGPKRCLQIDLPPATQWQLEQIANRMPSFAYGGINWPPAQLRDASPYAASRQAERSSIRAVFSATGTRPIGAMTQAAAWTMPLRR